MLAVAQGTTPCIGPGTYCTQGLTRKLTGSVIFRLVHHTPVASILRQDMSMAHDAAPELLKQTSLQWLTISNCTVRSPNFGNGTTRSSNTPVKASNGMHRAVRGGNRAEKPYTSHY